MSVEVGPMTSESDDERHERFVMLFGRNQPALYGYVLSLLPNWADADDVFQQTSLTLWRKFDQFEPNSNFMNWACQIARYTVLNFRKKHRRDRHVFSDKLIELLAEEAVAETDLREAERRALDDCLAKLPDSDRDLIQQCYAEGTTIKQVARQTDRTANSLYKLLNRIRATLLHCIQQVLSAEKRA